MDDQRRSCLCCAIVLVLTSLMCSSSFHLVNAQPVDYPIATVSTSWTIINDPPPALVAPDFLWRPILLRRGLRSRFSLVFCCDFAYTACIVGVLIQKQTSIEQDAIADAPQLVWSANRNHPVKLNATLQLTQDGNLTLSDSDGTSVWSTYTGGGNHSVSGLNLTEDGNLVLFDRNNAMVWQSFHHPTDSLLVGQDLVLGRKLTSSTSASNWSQGLFSLAAQFEPPDFYSLSAYVESNPPWSYLQYYSQTNYFKFENESFNGQLIPAASSSAQFIRLDPDGHLKVYEWGGSNWNVVADLLTSHIAIGDCGYPMVCGNYGICSSNGQCGCLEEATSNHTFRQINSRLPNLGCSLVTPISCNNSQYHTLLQLKNTSYFPFNSYPSRNYMDENIALEDCKKSCLKNCSCKAALFAYNWTYYSWKGCALLSEVFSLINYDGELINYEGEVDNITVFLKVHKSPTTQYPIPSTTNSRRKKSRQVKIILGSSLGAFFGVFFVAASWIFLFKKKREFEDFDEFFVDQVPGMPTRFSYEELRAMTNNFNHKLGEGGFGSVFQGTLSDGTNVAVKRLNGFGQVKKSFLAEVQTIGSIHHVNLVRLIGFCAEKSYRLLVYEYMFNGSLDKWIFQRHQELTLGWQSRRKIIMDIAKGLAYLHEDCRQKIFHLDIKPQNILLDEYCNAKISDFGLSKLIDKDQSQVVTTLRGTPGYLAPEWLNSIITEKVDVYSFGVVVLEMLCGRKNLDRSQPEEDMHLLSLFKRKAEEERLNDIVDKYNDEMQLHEAEVVEMMRVAVWCLQSDFSKRPSMSVVVKVLEGSIDVEKNLDYNFTNPAIPRSIAAAGQQEHATSAATTLLFPSALSGPRLPKNGPMGEIGRSSLGRQSKRKIIMEIAKGLSYLHEECKQKIFHLDIKPQNILLDEYFNAKISDFRLSKLIDKDQSQVLTTLGGTPGNMAPEWLGSIITEKVDVYSFGVGPVWSQPDEDMHLLSLFKRKAEEERLIDIIDKGNDEMQLHSIEVVEMMRVAVWCLQNDFSKRPSMSVVVKVLEGSVDVDNNLDYNFINPVIRRTIANAGQQEDAIGPACTLLSPLALSRPR
ncbi:unnamed protein product [Camellia sinensis]